MPNHEKDTGRPPRAGELTLAIGGITLAVTSGDDGPLLGVQAPTEHFLTNAATPDVRVAVTWGEVPERTSDVQLFDSGALWRLFRHGSEYVFRFASPARGPLPYRQASFNAAFTSGRVVLRRDCFPAGEPVDPLEYPLDELLIVHLLGHGRGVEVHACGLRDADGRGLLFLGQSRAGKTTTARLWEAAGAAEILSDDRIILRANDGRIWMYGTPWHGEARLASPAGVAVDRAFFLRQAAGNRVVPLSPAHAVARFLACSFVPFYDAGAVDFTVHFLQELTERVSCEELAFAPDRRVVDLARDS